MRNFWTCLLLVVMALSVAGCAYRNAGQDNSGSTQKMPQYTVASEIDYLPLEFADSANNYTGFEIELMQAIGKAESFEPVFKNMAFDDIINAVQSNKVDLGISALEITPNLQQLVNFSVPYLKTGLIIAIRKDDDAVSSLDDLKGKPLAARTASSGSDQCEELSSDVKHFDRVPDALAAVKQGDAVAVIDSMPITAYYVNQSPGDYKLVGNIFNDKFYGVAVAKNKPQLLQMVNDGLNKLKADGEYAALYKKWFGRDPESYLPGAPPQ